MSWLPSSVLAPTKTAKKDITCKAILIIFFILSGVFIKLYIESLGKDKKKTNTEQHRLRKSASALKCVFL
jgi:hypothetical protein